MNMCTCNKCMNICTHLPREARLARSEETSFMAAGTFSRTSIVHKTQYINKSANKDTPNKRLPLIYISIY